MRFLVQPAGARRARPPVRLFLAFAALALAALVAQRVLAGGLSPAGVEAYYLGGGEGEGLSAVALWEEVHAGAFLYGFLLFMLGSLLVLCPIPSGARGLLVAAGAVTTLADLFAPFAITGLGAGGGLRVASSLAAWATLAVLLAVAAIGFDRGGEDRRA